LLTIVCALEHIELTGAFLHEFLGLSFAVLAVVHLLLSWSWISTQTRKLFPIRLGRPLLNFLLNLSLMAVVTAVIFAGVMMSQEAIPLLTKTRMPIPRTSPWFFVHNQGSNFVVALAGLHLALNWEWSVAAGRRLMRRWKAGTA
jgi:hypothetical protein